MQYQEYLKKLNEIERLKKQRELEIEQVGRAHQEAEAAEQRRLEHELELKEKQIRDAQNRRQRGQDAIQNQRMLVEEKKALEEEILRIDRKKQV